jgi:3'-phosphoadenosine 5'-phosphosulfate sulfotransferase (PAPS reductase)/FAD synthetase
MQATLSDNIQSLIERGALFVSNHSGGKDSMACLIELAARVPKSPILVVHASLGLAEWPGALEKAQEHAESLGLPFIVAKANKSLFDMVERRHQTRPEVPSWPSASTRQCTSDLKRDPIVREVRAYANAHGYSEIVNCLGIRAQESTARAKRAEFSVNNRETTKARSWYEWLPVFKLSVDQVWALIDSQPVKRHYAYLLGNERLSCVFCIMSSQNDLYVGYSHNKALFEKYTDLEAKTGYTMHQSRKSLTELVLGPEGLIQIK